MIGDTLAKQVASPFEKYGFARLHYDFSIWKAKLLRSLGHEYERMLCHEYIARLLFDALMVFPKAESAHLQESAVGIAGKIAWDAEQIRCG